MMHNEKEMINYLSWLEYKKLHRVVRYYPTFKMYMVYRYYAKANNLNCFGGEKDPYEAHESLLRYLRERVQK